MMEVKTVVCPECARVWPAISEQGIFVTRFALCFSCVIRQVCEERDRRLGDVDYVIENCYDCAAQNPAMSTCLTCESRGWLASEEVKLIAHD